MKKIILFLVALSTAHQSMADTKTTNSDNQESLIQEIEEAVQKALKKTPTPAKQTAKAPKKVAQPIKSAPRVELTEVPPLPLHTSVAKTPKVVTKPIQPMITATPTLTNPQINLVNATNVPCTVSTAASMEQGIGGFNQTKTTLTSYSSTTMPLTNNAQQFISAQINAPSVFDNSTNSMPIKLTTPCAVINADSLTSEDAKFTFQYLPNVEQNGIVIINPTTKVYTLTIMNTIAEQINAPSSNPNYTVLTVTVPARATVPLPLFTNKNLRLHLIRTASGQVTKLNYPTSAGLYVLQEMTQDQMPRNSFRFNDYTSGTNQYLYLQPIASAS